MPGRMLRESICYSETLASLSAEAERLFYRLLTQADDFGRFDARPCVVRSRCFQLGGASDERVQGWLEQLCLHRVICLYTIEDKDYGHFPTWEKYQRIRSPRSRYPDPPHDAAGCGELPQVAAECGSRARASGTRTRTRTGTRTGRSDFAQFWTTYPKKRHKPDAQRAWVSGHCDADLAAILVGIEHWKTSDAWQRGFVEDPATFLRQRQWEDAVPAQPTGQTNFASIQAAAKARLATKGIG